MSADAYRQLLSEFRGAAATIPHEGFCVSVLPCVKDRAEYEHLLKKRIFLGEWMLPFYGKNDETSHGLVGLWVGISGAHAQCGKTFARLASRSGAALHPDIRAELADLCPSLITETTPSWFSLLWRIHDDIPFGKNLTDLGMTPYLIMIQPFRLSAEAIIACKLDTDTPIFPPPGDHWGYRVRKLAVESELRSLEENQLAGIRTYLKDTIRPIQRMDFRGGNKADPSHDEEVKSLDDVIADNLVKILEYNEQPLVEPSDPAKDLVDPELEKLDQEIPAYETASADWISNKTAADILGVKAKTLTNGRHKGQKIDHGTETCGLYEKGLFWRKLGKTHPKFYVPLMKTHAGHLGEIYPKLDRDRIKNLP